MLELEERLNALMGLTHRYHLPVVEAPSRASSRRTSLWHASSCVQPFHAGVAIALPQSVLDLHQLRQLPSHRVLLCDLRFCVEEAA
jgi:hypothetical protein